MGSRDAPGRKYTESGSGFPELVGPVPPLIPCHARLLTFAFEIQHEGVIQSFPMNICGRSQTSGTYGDQAVLDFSHQVFPKRGASSIYGVFVLQDVANGLPTGHETTAEKAYKRHDKWC